MRKVLYQVMVSLDGYFEGPDHDISWHTVDEEFNEHAIAMLNRVDTQLFGRVAYQLFEQYWPTAGDVPERLAGDHEIARLINQKEKVVFSKTLKEVGWNKARLEKNLTPELIQNLKQQPGRDISITGSILAGELAKLGLIDEYNVIISPVVLGKGRPFFEGMHPRLTMRLEGARTFRNGNVVLSYRRA